ncbi:MAG TPA: hypothetical protein VL463_23400 [Kofleriaceae bacterium]|jgi:hypothetical protein|nr:hypothetical protein [Kofleriaceae bacterium]
MAAGTALPKKLGIKDGHTVVALHAPEGFERALDVPDTAKLYSALRVGPVDVVVLFVDRVADLEKRFGEITSRMHPEGGFWVAWRKRRPTDITPEVIRCVALAGGMIDNKICEIDEVWSAIRLVVRVENRDALAYRAVPPLRALRMVRRSRRPSRPYAAAAGAGSAHRARARSSK